MVVQTRVVQVELAKMCRLRDIYTLESIDLKVGLGGWRNVIQECLSGCWHDR